MCIVCSDDDKHQIVLAVRAKIQKKKKELKHWTFCVCVLSPTSPSPLLPLTFSSPSTSPSHVLPLTFSFPSSSPPQFMPHCQGMAMAQFSLWRPNETFSWGFTLNGDVITHVDERGVAGCVVLRCGSCDVMCVCVLG